MKSVTYSEIEIKIKEIIIELLQLEKSVADIKSDENLFLEDYGYSSIDALELLILVEDAFEISIPEEKLNADLLNSVKSLADYVFMLMQEQNNCENI